MSGVSDGSSARRDGHGGLERDRSDPSEFCDHGAAALERCAEDDLPSRAGDARAYYGGAPEPASVAQEPRVLGRIGVRAHLRRGVRVDARVQRPQDVEARHAVGRHGLDVAVDHQIEPDDRGLRVVAPAGHEQRGARPDGQLLGQWRVEVHAQLVVDLEPGRGRGRVGDG